jgi:hypothetical protein
LLRNMQVRKDHSRPYAWRREEPTDRGGFLLSSLLQQRGQGRQAKETPLPKWPPRRTRLFVQQLNIDDPLIKGGGEQQNSGSPNRSPAFIGRQEAAKRGERA